MTQEQRNSLLTDAHGRWERAKRAIVLLRTRWLSLLYRPKRFVFVVSSGRSGSTLVQGLLNALPGVLVRGENSFYLMQLSRMHRRVRSFDRNFGRNSWTPTSAFYGIAEADPDDFVRLTRTLMRRQLLARKNPLGVRVLGFKEVRWEELRSDEWPAFFAFFERVFPNAQYVLNDRNPQKVLGSGHWQDLDRDTALARLEHGRELRTFLRSTRPDRTFDVTFEVITGKDEQARDAQLAGLAKFVVGREDAKTVDDLRAVLSVGHGPFPFGRSYQRRRRSKASS
jgi:hypothetical protein